VYAISDGTVESIDGGTVTLKSFSVILHPNVVVMGTVALKPEDANKTFTVEIPDGKTITGISETFLPEELSTGWKAIPSTQTCNVGFASIAYGGGKFVAGGGKGRLFYSSDGLEWAEGNSALKSSSADLVITKIVYGDNKFIAVSQEYEASHNGAYDSRMAYSGDGINWTEIDNPWKPYPIGGITYGITRAEIDSPWQSNPIDGINCFVMGPGYDGRTGAENSSKQMAYSTDGITWTKVTGPFGTLGITHDIAYGNGMFVALGGAYYTYETAHSTDGKNWIPSGNSIGGNGVITYGGGKFVAAVYKNDYESKLIYSMDGDNWTATDNPCTSWIQSIAYGGGMFVAGAHDGSTAYSSDGEHWTAMSVDYFTSPFGVINGIAYGDKAGEEKFVAAGRYRGGVTYYPVNPAE
jgi:hypothetical protein